MKNQKFATAGLPLFLSFCFLLTQGMDSWASNKHSSSSQDAVGVPLDNVIASINKSLSAAQTQLARQSPRVRVQRASVKLMTTVSKSGEGGFKIFAKASKKWTKETSSSMTFNFVRIEPSTNPSFLSVEDAITKGIVDAAINYKASKSISGMHKDGFSTEIAFSIKKSTSAGIEFELFGIESDLSSDFERTVFHSITLEFK